LSWPQKYLSENIVYMEKASLSTSAPA
jgi:hypothetical protein